jgi:hypothetical protein
VRASSSVFVTSRVCDEIRLTSHCGDMFMCPRKSINEEEKGNSPRRKISCVKIILVEYLCFKMPSGNIQIILMLKKFLDL